MALWSQSRDETAGGSEERCSCDAFLPSSTFPVADLVEVEQKVVEIMHKLELEMGKVLMLLQVCVECKHGMQENGAQRLDFVLAGRL